MTLSTRTLGRDSSLEVSMQGFGCMGMSQSYGTADRAESIATVHRAIDLGVTFFDTANIYGAGHNEELLKEALAVFSLALSVSCRSFKALRTHPFLSAIEQPLQYRSGPYITGISRKSIKKSPRPPHKCGPPDVFLDAAPCL